MFRLRNFRKVLRDGLARVVPSLSLRICQIEPVKVPLLALRFPKTRRMVGRRLEGCEHKESRVGDRPIRVLGRLG